MVIVRILGGFASQLGKYCWGYSLAQMLQTEFAIDISEYLEGYFRPLMIEYLNLPDVKVFCGKSEITDAIEVTDGKTLLELVEEGTSDNIYITHEEADYSAFFEKYPNIHICAATKVLQSLCLRKESDFLQKCKASLLNANSVGVHIRRGDFVTLGLDDNSEFFKAAIGCLASENAKRHFYFFSNDIEWAKEFFGPKEQFTFVDHQNGPLGDLESFFALAMCKDKILSSGSGYSLYANFLGISQYNTNPAYVLNDCNKSDKWQENSLVNFTGNQLENGRKIYETMGNCADYVTVGKKEKCIEHVKLPNKFRSVVIVTQEAYDQWKIGGKYALALEMATKGHKVLYINVNPHSYINVTAGRLSNSTDMDGFVRGFEILWLPKTIVDISEISKMWGINENLVSVYSDVPLSNRKKYYKLDADYDIFSYKYLCYCLLRGKLLHFMLKRTDYYFGYESLHEFTRLSDINSYKQIEDDYMKTARKLADLIHGD